MSRTVIKAEPGFRAELPGLDLPTLIQMTCARRQRLVVRVSSYGEEGFLYSVEGRLFHATLGDLVGDEAVLRMLSWPTGDFSICDRPFPQQATIESSTEGLLLRAAQRADEATLDTDEALGESAVEVRGVREESAAIEEEWFGDSGLSDPAPAHAPAPPHTVEARASSAREQSQAKPSSIPPPPPSSGRATAPRASGLPASHSQLARPPAPPQPRASSLPPPAFEASRLPARESYARVPAEGTHASRSSRPPAPNVLPPVSLGSSEPPRRASVAPGGLERRLPPALPPEARRTQPSDDVVASVRIGARGEIVGAFGDGDQLAQLVAYVSRIAALLQADFALDPFDALHAELSGKRVLIYRDDDALVGVTLKPGHTAQTLRQRLGV